MFKVCCALYYSMAKLGLQSHGIVQCTTDLEHLYRIYSIPTHDKHQWLLLQFIVLLIMEAKGVRNMQSILVVVNKHNTARVPFCWFIIYYKYLMFRTSVVTRLLEEVQIMCSQTLFFKFYVHVTVHRNKFLFNKTNQMH